MMFSELSFNSADVTQRYADLLTDADLLKIIPISELKSLSFDQARYPDPIYLSYVRWVASELLFAFTRNVNNLVHIRSWCDWIASQGEILHVSEILQIMDTSLLKLPRPIDPESDLNIYKHDGVLAAAVQIDDALLEGTPVGITSGVWDVMHMNHVAFLYEAAKALGSKTTTDRIHLCVGVDSSSLVARSKGPTRPLLPLQHRARAVSNIPFVVSTFTVLDLDQFIDMSELKRERKFVPFIYIGAVEQGQQLSAAELYQLGTKLRTEYAEWYARIQGNFFYFYGTGDPVAGLKEAYAYAIGATAVQLNIPFNDALHTSDLEKQFNLQAIPRTPDNDSVTNEWYAEWLKRED